MTAQLGAWVECRWPACEVSTRDDSGLCFTHRRYSGSRMPSPRGGGDAAKAMPQRLRLPTSMALAQDDADRFRPMLERSMEGMRNYPKVHLQQDRSSSMAYLRVSRFAVDSRIQDDAAYWDGEVVAVPHDGNGVSLDMIGGDLIVSPSTGSSQGIGQDDIRLACIAAKYQWLTHHARVYGYDKGLAEEYDDEAEAIAQLDLGDVAGGTLTIMDPGGPDQSQAELFRFTADDGSGSIAGELANQGLAATVDGEVVVRYATQSVMSDSGRPLTPGQQEMVSRLEGVRNVIARYAIQSTGSERVWLPIGWSDAQPPQFPS